MHKTKHIIYSKCYKLYWYFSEFNKLKRFNNFLDFLHLRRVLIVAPRMASAMSDSGEVIVKMMLAVASYARSKSSISAMLSPSINGASLSMVASMAARFFACKLRIFSSTVSRAMSL